MTEEKIIEILKSMMEMPIGNCHVEAINAAIKTIRNCSLNEKALRCINDATADSTITDDGHYLTGYIAGVLDLVFTLKQENDQ